MNKTPISINSIPAVLYGTPCNKVWLFVHGKCGCKEEGEAFAEIVCPKGFCVVSVDLPEHGERKNEKGFLPWRVVPELRAVLSYLRERCEYVGLRANSIGAWFSMLSFMEAPPDKALLVSPILDMEKLITGMMSMSAVTEQQLQTVGEIPTSFGETLSWKYLQYAKQNRIDSWSAPTCILYAEHDNMTDLDTVTAFANRSERELTVMPGGEHWLHTLEQLSFLRAWECAHT